MNTILTASFAAVFALTATAAEFHVAPTGNDANAGTKAKPLKTISAAAKVAQPGDVITVHEGVYRERINPPRGGTSDLQRITYQAAPGEKAVITGSEVMTGWEKLSGDTWKVVMPSQYFGNFNPYSDRIRGDWFNPQGRVHHTGCVYLNGDWMIEAAQLDDVMKPAGKTPLWFATVDGDTGQGLANLAWFQVGNAPRISGGEPAYRYGGKAAPCSEGGLCSGFNLNGFWLRFDGVDFADGSDTVTFRTAAPAGDTLIEIRLDDPSGEYLGTVAAAASGDWQKWQSFTATIKPTSGKRTLCLMFKSPAVEDGKTTIYAQFPGGLDPNTAAVEINKRQTVFYPSRNHIDYITVRGFTLEKAATNWAPPSSEQMGLIGVNWSKGWLIESNTVRYSKCSGIALGKYGDGTDNTNDAGAADPYTACVRRALANGWNKETVGSHIVRHNHIHHCEQTGIVGSMGAAFSVIEGNEIHDIHARKLFAGAEMAGIKLHAAVDVVIRNNHIYRCSRVAGLWLDWMSQGTRVTGNLMHDNAQQDIFLEVNHGPYLIDNNIFLSGHNVSDMSHGGAFVHNLFAGNISSGHVGEPGRKTPYLQPHATAIVDTHRVIPGDDRFCNNLFARGNGLASYDWANELPLVSGNLYLGNAGAWKGEQNPLVQPVDTKIKLDADDDGIYLTLTIPPRPETLKTQMVTSEMLGKATLVHQGFTNPDGSPITFATDYFGKKRDAENPNPGPFELSTSGTQTMKVWPKP